MPPISRITLIAALLWLSACQTLFGPGMGDPLPYDRQTDERTTPGCQGEKCPLVNIDTIQFPDVPALNPIITRQLLELTRENNQTPLPASLQAYQQQFLRTAQPGWTSYLQANVREQHDGLIIIELSSYLYTGGAHGMPGRGFINWDRRQNKVLTLQDILLPGQEPAFWEQARQIHQQWLRAQQVDQDASFLENWPFQQTRNFAIDYGSITLKYDAYAIAPYAYGHPELKIPYPRLNGIVRPNYFPGQGGGR